MQLSSYDGIDSDVTASYFFKNYIYIDYLVISCIHVFACQMPRWLKHQRFMLAWFFLGQNIWFVHRVALYGKQGSKWRGQGPTRGRCKVIIGPMVRLVEGPSQNYFFASDANLPFWDQKLVTSFSGWWFGTCFLFPFSWECHHPDWRTPSFFRGVGIPPTR